MKLMNKKFFFNIILFFFLAVALEFFVFNFAVLRVRMNSSLKTDQVFTLEDMESINWEQEEDGYISRDDPQLFFQADGPQWIENVDMRFCAEPSVTRIQLFYTDEVGAVQVITLAGSEDGSASCRIGIKTAQPLRIDLGDSAGTRLKNITVTLNSSAWHIAISRIVAVVLIYICSSLLFRIQRMPDYHLERKQEERAQTLSEEES